MAIRARLLPVLLLAGGLLPAAAAAQLRTAPELPPFPGATELAVPDSAALILLALEPRAPSARQLRHAASLSGIATVVPIVVGFGMIVAGANAQADATAYGGFLLGTAGLLMGPSIGYFSIERYGRAWTGFGIRTAGFLGSLAGAMLVCGFDCYGDDAAAAFTIFLVGTGLVGFSAGYDIVTLAAEARRAAREEAAVASADTAR